jgi:protein tyrosine/serine phosphatase
VVVHCHAGKDRTGIVVALALALVGVPDEEIARDYALSRENLAGLAQEWLDGITQDPLEREALLRSADPAPEAMLELLGYLRERYGGAEAYLRSAGMTASDLLALRRRLV